MSLLPGPPETPGEGYKDGERNGEGPVDPEVGGNEVGRFVVRRGLPVEHSCAKYRLGGRQ